MGSMRYHRLGHHEEDGGDDQQRAGTGGTAVKAMSQVLSNERMLPFINMQARLVTFENVTAVAVRQLTIVPKLIMALAK